MVAAALLTGTGTRPAILWAWLQVSCMDPSNQSEAGVLLDQLLESLLADFDHWSVTDVDEALASAQLQLHQVAVFTLKKASESLASWLRQSLAKGGKHAHAFTRDEPANDTPYTSLFSDHNQLEMIQ